jgi:murein DD-endopeptidase MepM/ murein hydrolase activator NlpD
MSHSSHSHSQDRSGEHAARQGRRRTHSATTVSQHISRAHAAIGDYTLVHGGRQVRVGPVAFWIVVGTLVIMAAWSIGTGTYFAFRKDVLSGLISRHARMQIAYEDRIAELRGEVDRITSRQLLDQEQFDRRLGALLKRQKILERRTTALADDGLTTGSLPRGKHDKDARLNVPALRSSLYFEADENQAGVGGKLTRVSHSLDRVAREQSALLDGMEQRFDSKARRMHSVLSELGVRPDRAPAEGGPYIPLKPPHGSASDFDKSLYRVSVARAKVAQYAHTLRTVPVRKPLGGQLDVTSTFGPRRDPFLGTPAYHPGLDLGGYIGKRVHATADGKVERAGWDGGYGNLVEIDNGHDITTRFGHLSKILVKAGQRVHRGQVIGLMGSTGRSTGPHLHYEVRVDGKAVNPEKFLRAGVRLGSL